MSFFYVQKRLKKQLKQAYLKIVFKLFLDIKNKSGLLLRFHLYFYNSQSCIC